MERTRWRRPSPALVIACLALFVALGGTVLAATKIDGRTIKVKSLPGNRVAVGSLPGNRLKPGTIPGSRLKPNSVTGEEIDATSLGQVPNADHATSADSARHAETAIAADHATDATTINGHAVGCPAGTKEFAGACWETVVGAAKLDITEAVASCAAEGGELPSTLDLMAFRNLPGVVAAPEGEWTNSFYVESSGFWSPMLVQGANELRITPRSTALQFRCVTPLLH